MKIVKAKHLWKEKIPGGKADGKEPIDYNADQLGKGTRVEMEHTDDPALATEIAMDHLQESNDKPGKPVGKYYDLLHEMEQVIEKRKDKAASETDMKTLKTAEYQKKSQVSSGGMEIPGTRRTIRNGETGAFIVVERIHGQKPHRYVFPSKSRAQNAFPDAIDNTGPDYPIFSARELSPQPGD